MGFLKIENLRKNLRKIGVRGGVGPSENRKPEENGSGERAVDKMKLVEIVLSLNNLICFPY